jgi:nitrite reductase (NADH) large subunit
MRRRQCEVTVIEHEGRLMPRQLDAVGGTLLAARIEALGVRIRTGIAVKEITGESRVTGLTLASGEEIPCDTVIICAGVRPNIALAQGAELAFNRGIIVNETMQTSDPDIFAVGECAQAGGRLYGLVGPGYLQAETAAAVIAGQPGRFDGAAPATKLKVIGADVFSVGEVEQLEAKKFVRSHTWQEGDSYRRIFIDQGKLAGALAVGDWPQASRVQDAVQTGATVYPWMLYRFRSTGLLWPDGELGPQDQPDVATLCNCTGVSYGQVRAQLAKGPRTVEAVSAGCGAGTVCGTCKPLLAEMIDAGAPPAPVAMWRPVLGLSLVALLGALLPVLLGYVPLPDSYDADSLRVWLWQDKIVKQWSGFILLGLTVAAFAIGLRKRFRITDRLGAFDGWRLVHIGIGVAALAGLFAHTGFNLGYNWNAALGWVFLAVLGIGAVAGLATGGDHALRARRIGTTRTPPRTLPVWVHIVAVWPLPVLIALHVLASYAY